MDINSLHDQAIEVLGSKDIADEWFETPSPWLDGRTPIDLTDTAKGVAEVEAYLTRIFYGVYS